MFDSPAISPPVLYYFNNTDSDGIKKRVYKTAHNSGAENFECGVITDSGVHSSMCTKKVASKTTYYSGAEVFDFGVRKSLGVCISGV
jgi:hypothetical protein